LANSEKNQAENDFAGIRYPPPLLQRRSCDTDHNKRNKWPSLFFDSRFLVRLTCASALLASLEGAFIKPVRTPPAC